MISSGVCLAGNHNLCSKLLVFDGNRFTHCECNCHVKVQTMNQKTFEYHEENGTWWANSPDLPGFFMGRSRGEVDDRIRQRLTLAGERIIGTATSDPTMDFVQCLEDGCGWKLYSASSAIYGDTGTTLKNHRDLYHQEIQ